MKYLKVSTSATIKLGPFLDDTDRKTAETGLAISQADIRLSKNGAAFAQTNDATGATHDENGWYGIPLNTTDTATLGRLKVAVHKSGALPCFAEFMVIPEKVYNSLVLGSDNLEVDATQIEGGDASDAINAEVADVLKTDTKGEPAQGAPGATLSIEDKIAYLYKAWRNKKDNDGSVSNLYADDASTVDQKSTISEAAGVVTKGEVVSGP